MPSKCDLFTTFYILSKIGEAYKFLEYAKYGNFFIQSIVKYLHKHTQDKEDDLKVGVKSTALRFGDLTKEWITGFGVACISSLALSGYNAEIGKL